MLVHSSKKKLQSGLNLSINGHDVIQVRCFKYLGVLVNDTLTWSDHIDMVCNKVTRNLNLLRRLSWFLPKSLLLLFLKSYIIPCFDYCDIVWSGCTKKEAHRLETLLNFGCRLVLRRRRQYSASAARRELGLTTLATRRKLHLAIMMHKCLSSQSPTSLPSFLISNFPLPHPVSLSPPTKSSSSQNFLRTKIIFIFRHSTMEIPTTSYSARERLRYLLLLL
jgi:hypothetical protein